MASSGKSERKLKPLPQQDRGDVAQQMAELARQQREKASVARAKEEAPTAPAEPEPSSEPEPVAETEPVQLGSKTGKKKVRPLVPVVGAALALATWFAAPGYLEQRFPLTPLSAQGIVSAEPSAQVFQQGRLLGETPLAFDLPNRAGTLELKRPGFVPETLEVQGRDEGKARVARYEAKLTPGPLRLDWSQLPEVKSLRWQDKPAEVAALAEMDPGQYKLQVFPLEGPPLKLDVVVPEPQYVGPAGGVIGGDVVKVGDLVKQALDRRPVLEMAVSAPKGKSLEKVKVKLVAGQGKPVNLELEVGKPHRMVLEEPGAYKATIAASDKHQAWSQEWKLGEGQSQPVEVALVAPKPKPKPVARTAPSSGSYYRPRRYTGGGGGGHRISAPSF